MAWDNLAGHEQNVEYNHCEETKRVTVQTRGDMDRTKYSSNFSQVFREILAKAEVSCYQISQYSHVDEAYLSRLKKGKKCNPSPEIVIRINLGLVRHSEKINIYDVEELFRSIGIFLHINK